MIYRRSNFTNQGEVPWRRVISPMSAFLTQLGLVGDLVVQNLTSYSSHAIRLATDKEWSYQVRVKILDALDEYDLMRDENNATNSKARDKSDLDR